MPRRERVPVRWGFVLMMGVVVLGALGAAAFYGSEKLSRDPEARKNTISFVKRTLGH